MSGKGLFTEASARCSQASSQASHVQARLVELAASGIVVGFEKKEG
jgi:hypothetical protein